MQGHKAYLRAKSALRDQHQDAYTLMLERHAEELDSLWANYNLSVKKLVEEHNKTLKSRMVTIRKRPKRAIAEKPQEKSNSQKAAAVSSKVLPMKKRVRRELDTKVEEQHVGQNGEVIDDIALINDNRPDRSAALPKLLAFMRL